MFGIRMGRESESPAHVSEAIRLKKCNRVSVQETTDPSRQSIHSYRMRIVSGARTFIRSGLL